MEAEARETYTVEISPYPLNFNLPPFELLFQGKSVVLIIADL